VSISLYDNSIPVFKRGLSNLRHYLGKGAEHVAKEGYDPTALLQSRLYPDMFPLTRQVQVASDMVKNGSSRVAGMEPPKWEDKEATFAELTARVDRTVEFLEQLSPEQINAGETREVLLPLRQRTLRFACGWEYLSTFVIPNFYFHCTTAYDILRHCGVKLGKNDFIGPAGVPVS
jgi:hypothetical protein